MYILVLRLFTAKTNVLKNKYIFCSGGLTEEEIIVQDDAQTQAPDEFQALQPESSQLAADIGMKLINTAIA